MQLIQFNTKGEIVRNKYGVKLYVFYSSRGFSETSCIRYKYPLNLLIVVILRDCNLLNNYMHHNKESFDFNSLSIHTLKHTHTFTEFTFDSS
jgi:hypothetical protein